MVWWILAIIGCGEVGETGVVEETGGTPGAASCSCPTWDTIVIEYPSSRVVECPGWFEVFREVNGERQLAGAKCINGNLYYGDGNPALTPEEGETLTVYRMLE
jgi:hypothetical protein